MHNWPEKSTNHGARRKWPLASSMSRQHPNPAHQPHPHTMGLRAYTWFGRRICVGRVILYNWHIEKVLDLSLHRFRDDIAPVGPILCPQHPVNCRCAFHPHCAFVAPASPSSLPRCRVAVAPSIAVALVLSIAVVDVALSSHFQ